MKWWHVVLLVMLVAVLSYRWHASPQSELEILNLVDVLESEHLHPTLRASSFWAEERWLDSDQWRIANAVCMELETPNCEVVRFHRRWGS